MGACDISEDYEPCATWMPGIRSGLLRWHRVYSHSWSEHLQHLWEMSELLQQAGLRFFGQDHTQYLGHVIGSGEVQPDPEKVQALQDYPDPRIRTTVHSFLGLAAYYLYFIPKFSMVATPLTQLTK